MELHPDFKDLLAVFASERVRYLLVGGYAVSYHARPRFTKDIDLWIGPDQRNVERAEKALVEFGAPESLLSQLMAAGPEDVLWMGMPPLRIDLLKGVPGGDFETAYPRRVDVDWGGILVSTIGLDDLIAIKEASGRPQDLEDLRLLREVAKLRGGES